ncbi:sugar ABC transporter ATP-binding protein [Pseudonocardia lutea]|uniref:Sugar ABC transporter ATP-binding protein n=1 Tax=Pseudonocardia lutea TaxID=2172015 RepID=A0ABW1I2K5_9PSEU
MSKSYGAVRALDSVDFELRRGEVMALLGENGAGKSTLVKLLSGLIQPDSGTIEIAGKEVVLGSPLQSQRHGVAVVQQEYSSVPTMTVAENLLLGDRTAGWWWSRARLDRGTGDVLDRVGLGHVSPRTRVEDLSVAESQLLELARMLRRDAQILILDEPTAALSDHEIERVLAVLRDLANEGRSIIYVTHRLDEVFRLADRVTVFKNGRSLPARDAASLDEHAVVTMMLGREMSTMFPERPELDGAPVRVEATELVAPGLHEPVSVSVRRGEILGVTGQLGSGANALVRALAGVTPAVGGRVAVDGAAVDLRSRRRGIAAGIAYCSDDRKRDGMFQGVSVLRNLSAPWLGRSSRLGVLRPRHERSTGREISGAFAFDASRLSANVETLSGGNQQKVVLGRWVGTDPVLLLVEEPTRGVDVGARAEIYAKLRDLASTGTSIIVASSDSTEILGLCDTIGAFYRGRLTSVRPHTEWDEPQLMAATMHSEATS